LGSISLWQDELGTSAVGDISRLTNGALEGLCETDVAVVGGGITGTAVALWLARSGMQVRVLEGRQIAAGASGRNGGLITGTTGEKYASLVARKGHDTARRLWTFHTHNAKLAEGVVAELVNAGWDCGYRHDGILGLAASEHELAEIIASAALLKQDGWGAEIVERGDLPQRLRATYYGGIYHAQAGELQPARFVSGLAFLAQNAGAIFHDGSPVYEVVLNKDGVLLRTPCGDLRARVLVLATNAWLPEIGRLLGATWLSRCITPTRGQVIATEPIDERIFPCPCSANEGYQYWRQLSDGRLVVGGWRNQSFATETTTNETPGEEVQRHLDAFVHETLDLKSVRVTHRWAGIMAFSADGLPLVGRLSGPQHCYISGGYTGHGNASALQAAYIISELVQGRTHPESDLFDPARFYEH
jgi:gamma-glutamylputrescine oxidase